MWKKVLLPAGLAAVLLLSAGCGASSESWDSYAAMSSAPSSSTRESGAYDLNARNENSMTGGIETADGGALSPEESTASPTAAQSRKIILNASFDLEAIDYENTLSRINGEIERTGSYIQYSNSSGSPEEGNARASLTVRVPSDSYNDFKAFVPTAGSVTYSSEGGEDVTNEYFDADTRVKVLKAQEDRVLELLDKAETVEDMLKIEEQLSRVRTEIEQLTGELKRYDDLVSYATVNLTVTQTRVLTPVGEENLFSRMGRAFQGSLESLGVLAQNVVIALVWLAPYLVIAAVIFFVIFFLLRLRKKKKVKTPPPSK